MTYESALKELQSIVDDMQDQRVSIDEMEKKVARAAELIRFCREKLRATGVQVERLLEEE